MKPLLTALTLLILVTVPVQAGEVVDWDYLIEREGLYYKKFNDVPFTGEITGRTKGQLKDGERQGPWVWYYEEGQLDSKGVFKDGVEDGPWVFYHDNSQLNDEYSGTYKDGVKID